MSELKRYKMVLATGSTFVSMRHLKGFEMPCNMRIDMNHGDFVKWEDIQEILEQARRWREG